MSVADRVYARALFDAALEENRLEPVREQLAQVVAAEKVTGRSFDDADHRRLIEEAVGELDLSVLERVD